MKKYFGTDGIRGLVGKSPINPEFMLKLGWAAGKVLGGAPGDKVIIGKDTRISGYMFESALQAGLVAAGVNMQLLGPMPTPAIAYLTRTLRAKAGIVISASHNPYYDNGIKFFSAEGLKLDDELELKIEAMMDEPMETVASEKLGKASRVEDAAGRYIEFCKSTIANSVSFAGLKIVLDCANGATYHVAPDVFRELGAEVVELATEPDGLNINRNCGATQPEDLVASVIASHADLGIAFDGDGDRVIMVDGKGEVVDGDEILFMIAKDALSRGVMQGGVVGTVMTNMGMELALKDLGVPFARSKVGDRYVKQILLEKGWNFGGESSGHILVLDKNTTGDGIVSALQVLSAMQNSNQSLYELKQGMHKCPQVLINVKVADKKSAMQNNGLLSIMEQAEKELKGQGRVLLRPSGTEPKIRVMVEAQDANIAQQWAETIAEKIV